MNDNLNPEIFVEDKVINLKDMLYYICKRWRSIGIVSLAGMVIMILIKIPALVDLKGIEVILKQLVKYAVIGFLIGVILICALYAVTYLISDKIKSEDEFRANCRLDILGVLPKTNGKKLNRIDRLIRRIFGMGARDEDFEPLTDRLAEEIIAILAADDAANVDAKTSVCLSVVSTETDETTKEVVNLISSKIKENIKFTVAGDILKDAASIRMIMESDKVLLIEKIGRTKYQVVEKTYKKLAKWRKNILGIVLLDGETR